MNCTCHSHPNPDCPRHGWREEQEIDPALQDALDRAEAVAVVVWACLIAAVVLAALAIGAHAATRVLGWAAS